MFVDAVEFKNFLKTQTTPMGKISHPPAVRQIIKKDSSTKWDPHF